MPVLDVASTDEHFTQILALQQRYHVETLSADEQTREGFVYTRHTLPLLRRMSAELPQAIALVDGVVVAYCLALPVSLRAEQPALAPMFEQFDRCTYHGRPLRDVTFLVGGQVCVDRAYRGRGLMARLYDTVRQAAPTDYRLCVTEVATRNAPSRRAHRRMGFEDVATYSDGTQEWAIVAWPWSRPDVED